MIDPTTPCVDCGEPRESKKSPRCPTCRARYHSRNDTERMRLWAANNPEKMRAHRRKWEKANPEKMREKHRRRHAKEDPDRQREQERVRWSDPIKRARRQEVFREWRKCNPPDPAKRAEIAKRWRQNHPEECREKARARRARKRAAFVANVTRADINRLMKLQRGRCPYCRCSIRDAYHVDHIVPLAGGGTHEPANVQLTCAPCNSAKGAKAPEAFAQEHGKLF